MNTGGRNTLLEDARVLASAMADPRVDRREAVIHCLLVGAALQQAYPDDAAVMAALMESTMPDDESKAWFASATSKLLPMWHHSLTHWTVKISVGRAGPAIQPYLEATAALPTMFAMLLTLYIGIKVCSQYPNDAKKIAEHLAVPGHGNVSTGGRRGPRFWPRKSPPVATVVTLPGH